MRRALLGAAIAVLAWAAAPTGAAAEPCPVFATGFFFPTIHGPADPEDYCWTVELASGRTLEQIDERQIAVMTKTGAEASRISAPSARDATGTEVPTSIALTAENLITVTVHHLAGNPAAAGAPYVYPVSEGAAYQTGPATVVAEPGTETPPPLPAAEPPAPQCVVPALHGLSLKAARRALQASQCGLGPVRGQRRPGARVVKQYRSHGKALPAGTGVGVKLG